jgi:hypothetical protein
MTKDQILPNGISQRIHSAGGGVRARIGMYPYTAKVVAEAQLHKGASALIERLTWRTQHLVHYGRRGLRFCIIRSPPLQAPVTAFVTLPIDPRCAPAGTLAL